MKITRKGQITIFFIVGVVVLLVFLGIAYLSKHLIDKEGDTIKEETSIEVTPVKMFIKDCLEQGLEKGLYKVFSQGGYYDLWGVELLSKLEEGELLKAPYYFYKEKTFLPPLEKIEEETAKATQDFFLTCIAEGFSSFEKEGYQLKGGEAKASITFKEKKVVAELDYPVQVIKGEKTTDLRFFSKEVPLNFLEKYQAMKIYFENQEKEPSFFLISDWLDLGYKYDFEFQFEEVNTSENNPDILSYLVFKEKLKEEPLVYSFALHYDWVLSDKEEEEEELKKILDELGSEEQPWFESFVEVNVTEPEKVRYQVKTEKEGLTFYDDVDWAEINSSTGVLEFDPLKLVNGVYFVLIRAKDVFGREENQVVIFNIKVNPGNLPFIKPIGKQTAFVGEEFYYQVEAENPSGGELLFTSDSYLFEINKKTGEISFVPGFDDQGEYLFTIKVENEYGVMWEEFVLEIKRKGDLKN